jgi:hypothetical protein
MSTKAEQHKVEQQRKNQRTNASKRSPSARAPATGGGEHKLGVEGTARRNLKTSPSHQKGGPALETSSNGKPSRKSTRGSADHIKLASNLQRRQVRRAHSPSARAERAAVR